MMQVTDLKVGHVYFSLAYADEEFTLPIVSTYQYREPLGDDIHFAFRILDEPRSTLQMTERDIEDLVGIRMLANALQGWAEAHPDLAS